VKKLALKGLALASYAHSLAYLLAYLAYAAECAWIWKLMKEERNGN
jgi:hypothetical protein